jgi:hypothetical protein
VDRRRGEFHGGIEELFFKKKKNHGVEELNIITR